MERSIGDFNIRRSRDDVAIAGICAGLADYFDVDALVVRILALLALLASFGAAAFAYLVLWAVIPMREDGDPITVRAEGAPDPSMSPILTRKACLVIWSTAFVACIGFAGALDIVLVDSHWWQFWPIIPFSFGIMMMVFPVRRRFHADLMACGIAFVGIGLQLLFCSIDLLSWTTVPEAAGDLWPLLAVSVGCSVYGHVRRSNLMIFASGLFVLVAAILAATVFGIPGDVDALAFRVLPGSEYEITAAPLMEAKG